MNATFPVRRGISYSISWPVCERCACAGAWELGVHVDGGAAEWIWWKLHAYKLPPKQKKQKKKIEKQTETIDQVYSKNIAFQRQYYIYYTSLFSTRWHRKQSDLESQIKQNFHSNPESQIKQNFHSNPESQIKQNFHSNPESQIKQCFRLNNMSRGPGGGHVRTRWMGSRQAGVDVLFSVKQAIVPYSGEGKNHKIRHFE